MSNEDEKADATPLRNSVGNTFDMRDRYGQAHQPFPVKGISFDRCIFVGVDFLVEAGDQFAFSADNQFQLGCRITYRGDPAKKQATLAPFRQAGGQAAQMAAEA